MTHTISSDNYDRRKDRLSWIIVGCFIFLIGALILARAGRVLELVFPILAVIVAAFFHQKSPVFYINFTWWIWFSGTLIRRFIDYYSGTYTYGPWHLTPMLVTSVSIFCLARNGPRYWKNGGGPILLSALSVIYGLSITLAQGSTRSLLFGVLGWLSPIAFCFYIFINWRLSPAISKSVEKSFLWSGILMGSYGIYQYIFAPAWDCFYLENPDTTQSFGIPEPFGIRVFSSLDAPHILGIFLIAAILLNLEKPSSVKQIISIVLSILTLLLTIARTSWISLAVGLLCLFPAIPNKKKIHLILFSIIIFVIISFFASSELFSERIFSRLDTFSNSENDVSYVSRKDALFIAGFELLFNFAGSGFGGGKLLLDNGVPISDNGILLILTTFGTAGTMSYMAGLLMSIYGMFKTLSNQSSSTLRAARSIVLSSLFQVGFVAIFDGGFAMILWGFIGLGLSSAKHDLMGRKNADNSYIESHS
jgi:hypothetical protein